MNIKKFFLGVSVLFASLVCACSPSNERGDYSKLWKQVEQHLQDRLPESAEKVLDTIEQKAMSEGSEVMMAKVLVYRAKIFSVKSQNPTSDYMRYIEQIMPSLQPVSRALAHLCIAITYSNYHCPAEVAPTTEEDPTLDLKFWDSKRLARATEEHFIAALQYEEQLKATSSSEYKSFYKAFDKVSSDYNSMIIEPTLYDFVVHCYIRYLENNISKMSVADPEKASSWWLPAASFVKLPLDNNDDMAIKTLALYQKVIAYNMDKGVEKVIFDNDIRRMNFVSQLLDDDAAYLEAFTLMQQQYSDPHSLSMIAVYRASRLMLQYQNHPDDTSYYDNYKKAFEICSSAVEQWPNTKGANYAKSCLKNLTTISASIRTQEVYLPQSHIPMALKYRNTSKAEFRIYKLTKEEQFNKNSYYHKDFLKKKIKEKHYRKEVVDLPVEDDYREHTSLIALQPLPEGAYLILMSPDGVYADLSKVTYASFQVTGLSFVFADEDNEKKVFVLDRETGTPRAGVQVAVMTRKYNYDKRDYETLELASYISDQDGKVIVPSSVEKNNSIAFYLSCDDDTFFSGSNISFSKPYSMNADYKKTYYFTDRAIYRPGQTVFFKGVMVHHDLSHQSLICDDSVEVSLYDANGKKQASQKFVTDEFGAFDGSFVLPMGLLNGNFTLQSKHGCTTFYVEEYKRPTFEVKMERPKEQYKLNQRVRVEGSVKALSGFGLDGVSYRYHVVRKTSFPWRWFWWSYRDIADEQIAKGEGLTDESGCFSVEFDLIPSATVSSRLLPFFTYEVYVEATNAQGETRRNTCNIFAAYHEVSIRTSIPQVVEQASLCEHRVTVTNLSGNPAKTNATRKLYRVKDAEKYPSPYFNSRDFDRKILSDEQLHEYFPHFDYYSVTTYFAEKELILDDKMLVDGSAAILPSELILAPGRYYLELGSADDENAFYATEFVVYQRNSVHMPYKSLCWSHLSAKTAQPGQSLTFSIGSSAKGVKTWVQIKRGEEIRYEKWLMLNDNVVEIPYTVKEEDRGGLTINACFVIHNTLHLVNERLSVPYDNMVLDVEVTTLRDQLCPGDAETWEVVVRDYKNRGMVSQLLASMYDASLDAFTYHYWNFVPTPKDNPTQWVRSDGSFRAASYSPFYVPYQYRGLDFMSYNWLCDEGLVLLFDRYYYRGDRRAVQSLQKCEATMNYMADEECEVDYCVVAEVESEDVGSGSSGVERQEEMVVQPRTNFNETAFFMPRVQTASDGTAKISFKMPDAITRWNLMMMAYSKDLKVGMKDYQLVTNKPLMILSDLPRLCYENDTLWLVANVVNTGDVKVSPKATLEVFDAVSMEPISALLSESTVAVGDIEPGRSQAVRWKIRPKHDLPLLALRFTARDGKFADAEQKLLPVLSNEVFMVETMPITVKSNASETFHLDYLDADKTNERNHALTLNFSANPVWYAVQALPSLLVDDRQRTESCCHVLYTNCLAAYVATQIPAIADCVSKWESETPDALRSALEKDESLKAIVLGGTPWVVDAKNESEMKARISGLFDEKRRSEETQMMLTELAKRQKSSGGWTWIEGMPESRFITRFILVQLGRLEKMGAIDILTPNQQLQMRGIRDRAARYIREQLVSDYERMCANNIQDKYSIDYGAVQELYALSLCPCQKGDRRFDKAYDFYLDKIRRGWTSLSYGVTAKAAIVLYHSGDVTTAKSLIASLRECAVKDNDLGMYWPQRYFSWNSPLSVHVDVMEAFAEICPDDIDAIDAMRLWLLNQKRTNSWGNDNVTAEAVYALLMRGSDWLNDTVSVTLKVGDHIVATDNAEAGTGFVQRRWEASEITPDMANVSVDNPTNHLVWGGLFRQYFVPIDEVEKTDNPLKIKRELYVECRNDDGAVLKPLEGQKLKVGDKITVWLTIECPQDMEYVFVKDLRAAGLEPEQQLSYYRYESGFRCYRSVTDAYMGFYIDHLPKGTHLISHSMYVTKEGDFSNGYALIQCLFAPEFSAYSNGMRLHVGE